jgi:hypothetical protein
MTGLQPTKGLLADYSAQRYYRPHVNRALAAGTLTQLAVATALYIGPNWTAQDVPKQKVQKTLDHLQSRNQLLADRSRVSSQAM